MLFLLLLRLQVSPNFLLLLLNVRILLALKVYFPCLDCVLRLSLLFDFKPVSKLIKVPLSISLKLQFHIPAILF